MTKDQALKLATTFIEVGKAIRKAAKVGKIEPAQVKALDVEVSNARSDLAKWKDDLEKQEATILAAMQGGEIVADVEVKP